MRGKQGEDVKHNAPSCGDGPVSANYAVGYRRPPARHQFKKGVSGNIKGRPRKRERAWNVGQLCADILAEANKELVLTTNGKSERLTKYEWMIRRILLDAIQGSWHAQKLACEIIRGASLDRARLLPKLYSTVEDVEERTFTGLEEPDRTILGFLDYYKKKTQQT